MSSTATAVAETASEVPTPTLTLRSSNAATKDANSSADDNKEEPYRYAHLLPVFVHDHYPPLEPFQHVDPGFRALEHPNPRSFLDNATSIVDLLLTLAQKSVVSISQP